MARTPQSTRTPTMRSSEHAAHRPLMHSVHTSHLWLKSRLVCHPCHPCMRTCGWCLELSVFFLVFLSFYFLSLFLFQLYLMSTSAPDEMSVSNPLCDSSLGSVVTSDYVTPLTQQVQKWTKSENSILVRYALRGDAARLHDRHR